MRKQEEEVARKKQDKAANMLVQVEASNKLAQALKDKKKLEEKEMDDAIFRYNKDKQQREYENQMEAQRIQNEKEKETQKLRDQ